MYNPALKSFRALQVLLLSLCFACTPAEQELPKVMAVSVSVNGRRADNGSVGDIPSDGASIEVEFTSEVNLEAGEGQVVFAGGEVRAAYGRDKSVVVFTPVSRLDDFRRYVFTLPAGEHFGVNLLEQASAVFTTQYDQSDKFERIPDDELLTLVQRQTFKYFWDYAHPVSGLARERLGSGETVTTGGSGFGIMCLPVGVERGFVTRAEAADRLRTIVQFLGGKAQRFHGVYSHWLNGTTGAVIPFSTNDNGADLVETAFLIEGLLAAAGYFDKPEEADIRSGIYEIWRAVEWDWFTRGGQNVLYWHWSPDKDWAMNMHVSGWNEALMVYWLALRSPTHPVSAEVFRSGWARGGGILNGRKFYDITLPAGSDYGGPMFFAHYSFMGLNPMGNGDEFVPSYWEQNVAHAKINHAYCAANPKKHAGYSAWCWGLTASDIPDGYAASSPTSDKGVIAPTAALASMPYTPIESIDALRTFYYVYGDRLWGEYGFYDAFSLDAAWFAKSCIAIDQGPIVVMIENYRTGLLWDCFAKYFSL